MADQTPEYTPTAPPPADGHTVPEATPSQAPLATAAVSVKVPGYDIVGELGRGGMGAVLKGRDPELGRELAVKVLLERHHGDARTAERFREEAQVGGQLQHPGVVPVYALGRLADGRPFFTMKLVEGRTLAALLKERPSPAHELPRFLHVFEQICQTLAYAHSKGVIHRDLKPLNVMVGAFGEVQVMDWGLAKVLRLGAVQTVRSGRPESESAAGSVLGTPAYMAPEQACGDVEGLDARCDVFGLGAVLCEVLTGAAPYRGRETGELLRKAARADLADAFGRLDGCGADGELVALAKACLSAEASDRPSDAGSVASAVTAHLAGVQERLHKAELERAAAQAKAAEERKRRRLTLALAATVLLAVVGAGTAAFWYQAEHARRAAATERDVTAALEEATVFSKQAAGLHDDPAHWEAALAEALSAVKRADGVLNSGEGADKLRPRVDALRQELETADKDRRMIARLQEARFQRAAAGHDGLVDKAGATALYAAAFREDGLDLASLEAGQAAERINGRAIREELLAALADWSNTTPNRDDAQRLRGVLEAADPDPASFRNRWNAALEQRDWDTLEVLAFNPEMKEQPAARLVIMAGAWSNAGNPAGAVKLLKDANERHAGDFWIIFELAYTQSHTRPPALDEAIRYYTAALALRPSSPVAHNNLGVALMDKGRLDEAIAEYKKVLQIRPDDAAAHNNLGVALYDKGQLDEAMAEYRKAIQIRPDHADAHNNLGNALRDKHRLDEAIAEYRKALQIQRDYSEAHNGLGNALKDEHRLDEAIAEYRKALQIQPDHANAHNGLGVALRDKGRLDEAIVEFRKALQIQPNDAATHNNYGLALRDKGRLDEAIAEYKTALQIQPDFAAAHYNLGNALHDKGRVDEVIAEFRKTLQIQPDYADAHRNLGAALLMKGQPDAAITELHKALQVQPDDAGAHNVLGGALHDKHRLDEAIAEFRKAIELKPADADAHNNLGNALHDKGRLDEAIAELRKAIQIQPADAGAHYNLGVALFDKHDLDEAITEYRKALQIDPGHAEAHNNLGVTLRDQGRWDEAIAEYKKALQIQPDFALAHNNLRNALALAERDALLPAILRGEAAPADAVQQVRFAFFCQRYKRLDATASRFYADAFAAEPSLAWPLNGARYNAACAAALAGCGQGEDAATTGEKERSRWRKQALDWLRADLVLWIKRIDGGKTDDRAPAAQVLQHWQEDADLAGVRDADALTKLPAEEREAWRKLWDDVDAGLKKTQGKRQACDPHGCEGHGIGKFGGKEDIVARKEGTS